MAAGDTNATVVTVGSRPGSKSQYGMIAGAFKMMNFSGGISVVVQHTRISRWPRSLAGFSSQVAGKSSRFQL